MEGREVWRKLSLSKRPVSRAEHKLLFRHGKMVTLCEHALIKVNVKFVLHLLITCKTKSMSCALYMANDNV